MLSEIETRGSTTMLVGIDAVDDAHTVYTPSSDALRLPRKGSNSENDSFFYVAMRISRHKAGAHLSDRTPVIA
jgi:hypothetical protein